MSLLIAAIIIATTPTFSITLSEPSRVVSAKVEFKDIKGQEWEFQAYPSTWVADFPASATEPGIFRIYIGDATEESEVRGGGIVSNRYPIGYRMFKPVLHTPGPLPVDQKWRSWPSTPWGRLHWMQHYNRWADDWSLIDVEDEGGRYWTLWEARP